MLNGWVPFEEWRDRPPEPEIGALVKAKPAEYHGVTFRSTLEADWACTLDHYGIAWE